jgi:hypothetical protein
MFVCDWHKSVIFIYSKHKWYLKILLLNKLIVNFKNKKEYNRNNYNFYSLIIKSLLNECLFA